jgi:2-phospho-L-lactate guanylyltransferase
VNCHLLLAVRPPEEGKSRLAGTLDDRERIQLNYSMFRHVLKVGSEVFEPNRIVVISRSAALLDEVHGLGIRPLAEMGSGLNPALEQAADQAIANGANALLSLSSDLPALTADDLHALLDAPAAIAIGTDRARQGTNALRMRPAGAIPFRYGVGSLTAHLAEARAAGLEAMVVERPGLANDIDTPADLADYRG